MAAREEPSRGLLLKFKYPNGFIRMRKFTVSEPIQVLFDFVGQDEMASEIFSVQEATLSTPIESTSSESLMDHGINTSATLYVLWISTLNIQEMITDQPNNGVFDCHPLPSAQAPATLLTLPSSQALATLPSAQALATLPSAQAPPALPSAQASLTQPSVQAPSVLLSSQVPAILSSVQTLSTLPFSQAPLIPAVPSDQAAQVMIIEDRSLTFPPIEPPIVILEDQEEQLCLSPLQSPRQLDLPLNEHV
ncbi:hypothetical protein MHYP_G00065920 [Metynnis hypsauchen]